MSASHAAVTPNAASRWPAISTTWRACAAPIRVRSWRRLRSNNANIGPSKITPSSRPSRSRPNAPPGGSGCPSANPASRSAAVFSTQACSDVWYTTAGRCGTAWSRSARVGCRPSRSLYSTYPPPVTQEPSGVRPAASRSRAWMAGMSGADGWLQSAAAAR